MVIKAILTERSDTAGPGRIMVGAGGVLALLAASCCILPTAFSLLGLAVRF